MKQLQAITLVAVATALTMLIGASTASATTLEVGGIAKNETVAVKATASGSTLFTNTFGEFVNTCTRSTIESTTASPFTATQVGGPVGTMTFESCTNGAITVDAGGSLSFEAISGTTNATVFSRGAKWTTPSPFGTLTCTTAATGTDFGKITGVKEGTATIDIAAVLNCGLITAKWSGTYNITSPVGLGVTA